jgi:very-short-patch-repair endonuclease
MANKSYITKSRPGCLASVFRMLGLEQPAPKVRLANPVSILESALPDIPINVRSIQPEILPYRLRDDFLSPAETSFYQVLKSLVGAGLVICPQVSLAELFFVPRSESFQTYQNKIDRKRVDFLLCDPKTLKPLFAIELDDSSHTRPDRQERDAFVEEVFAAAQLPLLRIPARQAYNTTELIALFKAALQKKPSEKPIDKQPVSAQAQPPLCPKCGVPMLLRTAKKGNTPGQQFYGCPNYPRCRAVIPIKSTVPALN